MKLEAVTTLTGKPIMEAFRGLDQELTPFEKAYKAISGGAGGAAGLTDITPGYLIEVLLETFGPLGIGWGYEVESLRSHAEERQVRDKSYTRTVWMATARVGFWYAHLTAGSDEVRKSSVIPGSGGSENEKQEWAEKGAVTNALGMITSHMGYQVSVYKGLRSHRGGNGDRHQPKRTQPAEQAKASVHRCPSCNRLVEDNRARHAENYKSPAWRCQNQQCTGGSKGKPWASWHTSEFDLDPGNPPEPQAGPTSSTESPSPTTSSPPRSAGAGNGSDANERNNRSSISEKDRFTQADLIEKAREFGIDAGALDLYCRNNLIRKPLELMSGGVLVALAKKLEPEGGEITAWLDRQAHRSEA
jgi:hypothetical protein